MRMLTSPTIQTDAEHVAYLHLISILHTRGLLHKIYKDLEISRYRSKTLIEINGSSTKGQWSAELRRFTQDDGASGFEQHDRKLQENHSSGGHIPIEAFEDTDMYLRDIGNLAFDNAHNFCARLGLVPVINVSEEWSPISPRGDRTLHCILQVKLPDHQISVTVRAPVADKELQEQEQVAFTRFNKEMHDCHTIRALEASQERDSQTSLTLENAEQFVRFLRSKADTRLARKKRGRYREVRIRSNGIIIGTGCSISKVKAKRAAWLATAVNMAKESPELLDAYFDSAEVKLSRAIAIAETSRGNTKSGRKGCNMQENASNRHRISKKHLSPPVRHPTLMTHLSRPIQHGTSKRMPSRIRDPSTRPSTGLKQRDSCWPSVRTIWPTFRSLPRPAAASTTPPSYATRRKSRP